MEHAAPVWHTGVTADRQESIESLNERALGIIVSGHLFTPFVNISKSLLYTQEEND